MRVIGRTTGAGGCPRAAWSEAEENALRVFYPSHGPSWDGWAEVLPGKTEGQIRRAASKRGIRLDHDARATEAEADELPPRDASEAVVTRLLAIGLAPSAIDRRQRWWPGTAAAIAATAWRRDQERKERAPHPRAVEERRRMAEALGARA